MSYTMNTGVYVTEDNLKIERIRNVMMQEQQLADLKLRHEQEMASIKQHHLKEVNYLELRTLRAKAELAELLMRKERDMLK